MQQNMRHKMSLTNFLLSILLYSDKINHAYSMELQIW